MSNIDFVNMHRYQAIEKIVYQKVKEWKPTTIVELGHGSGALTVAASIALKEINSKGKIHSYDIIGESSYELSGVKSDSRYNIKKRGLNKYVNFIEGDVFEKWVNKPFSFDLLIVDIDNTWEILTKIFVDNKFINNEVKKGAKVLIEGGDPNHPRINNFTLDSFIKERNKLSSSWTSGFHSTDTISFKLTYLGGSGRTSISNLEL